MARQIICMDCAAKNTPGDYPGEWWRRVVGYARGFHNGDFVCDLCNTEVPKGTQCVAQSFGIDRHPYEPWEHEFISDAPKVAPGVVDGTIRVIDEDGVHEYPPDKRGDIKL